MTMHDANSYATANDDTTRYANNNKATQECNQWYKQQGNINNDTNNSRPKHSKNDAAKSNHANHNSTKQ